MPPPLALLQGHTEAQSDAVLLEVGRCRRARSRRSAQRRTRNTSGRSGCAAGMGRAPRRFEPSIIPTEAFCRARRVRWIFDREFAGQRHPYRRCRRLNRRNTRGGEWWKDDAVTSLTHASTNEVIKYIYYRCGQYLSRPDARYCRFAPAKLIRPDMTQEIIIEAGRAERHYWRDLWRYRELFRVLAWRDVAVRYKQTVIGAAWAIIRPFLTMVVFTVIFGKLANLPSEGTAPYAIMVFAGMLPWTFFSSALSDASNSMVGSANLISKVYFPRLIVPMAAVGVAFVDFAINFMMLVALMIWYQFVPGWQIVLLPAFVALALLAGLGPGLWLTALNVKYRDVRYIIPFLVQLGLYASPVGYSSSIVPEQWRLLYSLNPVVGVIDGFRWCILGGQSQLYLPGFLLSIGVTAFFLWLGIRQFRKMENSFADLM